jgi:hypothetical protein
MKAEQEKCGATCPDQRGGEDFVCGRPAGHSGKHDSPIGPTWTDGGAERLRAEIAAKILKQ